MVRAPYEQSMVEILALGPLSLQKTLLATLVRHANRVQNHFRVFVGDPIGGLGLPDASGEYEAATLGRLLQNVAELHTRTLSSESSICHCERNYSAP